MCLTGSVLPGRVQAMQHGLHTIQQNVSEYKLQFFTPDQNRTVDALADTIIPADERSGGAHDARVSFYIDLVAANSDRAEQVLWTSGIDALDRSIHEKRGKRFTELTLQERAAVVEELAGALHKDEVLAKFYHRLRTLTIAGYYTSRIGLIDDLGYVGNQALSTFPEGCVRA